jgi:hypothetical protein
MALKGKPRDVEKWREILLDTNDPLGTFGKPSNVAHSPFASKSK